MDIANLQAFIAVAECRSFSTASQQLFVTQPAISKRIASLESELDARLFDRIGRHVTLTEAGRALLPRAQKIILQVEDSRRAIQNLAGEVTGALSIGTSHHIGLHRLPPILRQFTADYPEVELDIQFMDSEAACRAIEHGDLELAIVTLPLVPSAEINTQLIWHDPLSVVVNKAHPVAQRKPVTLEQLANYNAILPSRGTFTREIIERAMQSKSIKLNVSMATNYLETIKMMVSVGLGWSVLPDSMISKEVKAIPIRGLTMARQLGIVWHGGRTLSNAAQAIQDILLDTRK